MNYIDALKRTAKRLDAEFEASQLIHHSATKGVFRELDESVKPFANAKRPRFKFAY